MSVQSVVVPEDLQENATVIPNGSGAAAILAAGIGLTFLPSTTQYLIPELTGAINISGVDSDLGPGRLLALEHGPKRALDDVLSVCHRQ